MVSLRKLTTSFFNRHYTYDSPGLLDTSKPWAEVIAAALIVNLVTLIGVVFIAGEYNDSLVHNSTWSTGDWNGDREFTSDDIVAAFTAGGYLAGPRGAYPVPEAHGTIILAMAIYGAARCRQRRNRTC